jgi:enoyl-CoA hydratase/carnithine racemase
VIDLEFDGTVAIITVNRPQARNAVALATMGELEEALDAAAGAGALVVTGAGERAFVSGGDLKELAAIRTEAEAEAMALRMRRVCDRIAAFPAPVVAALNGHAIGGGAELAVAADIRVAADDATIAFNQAALAIMPAWGGLDRLGALVGRGRALLLAGTGRAVGAAEAERLGLVDLVLPRAGFDECWRALARSLATPSAREIKRVLGGVPVAEAAQAFARLWTADEHWAAVDAVLSRRR